VFPQLWVWATEPDLAVREIIMNYFVDLSRMSLGELLDLRLAAEQGWFDVDFSNLDLLAEHIIFRIEVVERLERTLNRAVS
jgi:hypothetical protein